MPLMTEKEKKIAEAAVQVFSRYGVKRTTMNDIASEAGIARQTLYNAYSSKDDVLRAVIRWYSEKAGTAIATEFQNATDFGSKLEILFKHLVVEPYELVHNTPHADDVIEGFNDAAKQEILTASEQHRSIIEEMLFPYETRLKAVGLSTFKLSDFIQNALSGIKYKADSKAHLIELLQTLKALLIQIVERK